MATAQATLANLAPVYGPAVAAIQGAGYVAPTGGVSSPLAFQAKQYLSQDPVAKHTLVAAGVWGAIAGFILLLSFIWIILFSFRPSFVRRIERGETVAAEDAPADPARCFVAALIIALLLVIIAWMFSACK